MTFERGDVIAGILLVEPWAEFNQSYRWLCMYSDGSVFAVSEGLLAALATDSAQDLSSC